MTDIKDNKSEDKKKIQRKFEGIVVSSKMDKTVTIKVEKKITHKKYQKKYTMSKRFKCHDEKNEYKVGDTVLVYECRPISKDKKWRVIKKVNTK